MADCPFCKLNTARQHETHCPLHPMNVGREYVWHGGHRYRLVLDDPEPEMVTVNIIYTSTPSPYTIRMTPNASTR